MKYASLLKKKSFLKKIFIFIPICVWIKLGSTTRN